MDFDKEFWRRFRADVVSYRKWYLSELSDDLLKTSIPDGISNSLKVKLQHRRSKALELRNDPTWSQQICQAVLQLSSGQTDGEALRVISSSHLLNPLEDYVKHLQHFVLVAKNMINKGVPILPLGPNCSRIHDLDKLDPVMLAGYAERFEDGLETELWSACVKNHVTTSPHHPEHSIWQLDGTCTELGLLTKKCCHCEGLRFLAVSEMVVDRVSRRVQKELGAMGPAAWDISPTWFSDLPGEWFDNALSIIKTMKDTGN